MRTGRDDLAMRALGRLWPNREHESNWLKALLCAFGMHRWHTLTIGNLEAESRFDFCRWCPEIRRQVSKIAVVATVLLLITARVSAHHAFAAEYDAKKRVMVSGALTKITWDNPHAWMYVEGKDDSGNAVRWSFEMGSPNGLLNRGWKKSDLKEGEQVTVEGFGAKDGSNVANASTVTLADGRKLFGGFQSTPGAPARRATSAK